MTTNFEANFIGEQTRPLGYEQRLSRRALISRGGNLIAAAAVVAAGYKLTEGISLSEPPLVLETVEVDRKAEDIELFSVGEQEEEGGIVTIISENELIFEPSGEFFTAGREFSYLHRANSIEYIHKAHDMGADLFDIDANDVDGTVYGEHGMIPEIKLGLGGLAIRFHLPAVVDPNEKEIKLGMPSHSYEELVACVGSLSTDERPAAVSTELKRGDFELDTLYKMFAIHRKYNVPAIMHSTDPRQFDVFDATIARS